MFRRAVSPRAQAHHCQSVVTASCRAVVAALLSLLVSAAVAQPLPDCAGCDPRDAAACELRYGAAGTVFDALTGEPIAGATITVLDLQGTSGADGSFRVEDTRTEQCHIDYLYTLNVSAPGYQPYDLQLYANHTFIEMPIELVPEGGGFTVSGIVAEFLPCSGRMRGVTVILEPLGLMTTTSLGPDGGEFTFENVPPGDYTVRVSPACSQLDGCWRETELVVSSADVSVNVCLEPDDVRRITRTMPLRKVAQPEDVAAQVVTLASERLSGHVTGELVTVAGGMEGRMLHAD